MRLHLKYHYWRLLIAVLIYKTLPSNNRIGRKIMIIRKFVIIKLKENIYDFNTNKW